jgi:uncharacterized protein
MEIDKLLYIILKKYKYSNRSEIRKLFRNNYPGEKISEAIDTIDSFNKNKGGFGLVKDIKFCFPFAKSQYKRALENLVNHMVLNVTEKCNFHCQYCKFSGSYSHARKHSSKSMDIEVIKKSIDFLVKNASYIINETDRPLILGFYGGEPMIEFESILNALRYIEKEYKDIFPRFRFSVTTNGSLLSENVIKELVNYNFTLLLSHDGPAEISNRYRMFRDGKGAYDIILEKMELVKKISPDYFENKVGFSTVIVPEFHFREVVEYFRNTYKGKNRVYLFSMLDDKDTDFFDRFDMKTEWKKYRKDKAYLKKEYKNAKLNNKGDVVLDPLFDVNIYDIHKRGFHLMPDELFPNGICLPGLHKVFVDTNGNFHLCEKINWKFIIGDVYEGFNIDMIFHILEEYIKTTDICKKCWAVRLCKVCYLTALKNNRFSIDEKKRGCKGQKKRILENIKDYLSIVDKKPEAFDGQKKEEESIAQEVFKFLRSCTDSDCVNL